MPGVGSKTSEHSAIEQLQGTIRALKMVSIASFALAIMAIAIALISIQATLHIIGSGGVTTPPTNTTVILAGYNVTSPLILPNTTLPNFPTVTQNQTFGSRLTGINSELNSTELAAINDGPNSYYELAGEMLLNNSLSNNIGASPKEINPVIVNGKLSVIYLGSITCIYCGENRWAMALALSRFGSFSKLFIGYSSFGDDDVPTLYWSPAHYSVAGFDLGSFYNSSYINFIAMDNAEPITQGFNLQSFTTMQQEVNASGNHAYIDAFEYIVKLNDFAGTPYTIWGNYEVGGADAVVFGNTTPTTGTLPLEYMTHAQIFSQLATPNDQFAYSEYAAADVYVAMMCKSLGNTASSVSACSLPAIQKIEQTL